MSASVKGLSGLEFGVPEVSGVVLQNVEERRSNETAEARDEDGDVIGFAVYGGERQEISGEYLWKGDDIADLGASVSISGISSPGGVYVTEIGSRRTNTGFR